MQRNGSASDVLDKARRAATSSQGRSLKRSETAPQPLQPLYGVADTLLHTFPTLKRSAVLDETPKGTPRGAKKLKDRKKFRPTATAAAALAAPSGEDVVRYFATHGSEGMIKFVPLVGEAGLREEKRRRELWNESRHRSKDGLGTSGSELASRPSTTSRPATREAPPSPAVVKRSLAPLPEPVAKLPVRDRVVHDFAPYSLRRVSYEQAAVATRRKANTVFSMTPQALVQLVRVGAGLTLLALALAGAAAFAGIAELFRLRVGRVLSRLRVRAGLRSWLGSIRSFCTRGALRGRGA